MNLPETRDSLIIQDLPEYFSTMNIDKHIHQTLSYDLKVLSARKINHWQGLRYVTLTENKCSLSLKDLLTCYKLVRRRLCSCENSTLHSLGAIGRPFSCLLHVLVRQLPHLNHTVLLCIVRMHLKQTIFCCVLNVKISDWWRSPDPTVQRSRVKAVYVGMCMVSRSLPDCV